MLLARIKVTEEMGPENRPPLWPRAGCPPTTGPQTVMSGSVWASPAVPPEKGELPPPVLPPQGMAVRGQEQQDLRPTWPWQPLLVSSSCAEIPSFLLQVSRTDFAGQKGRYLWTNRVGDRRRSGHAG